nr:hypothetical protein [Anaeromassilibacillus sp. An172]
MAFNVSTVLKLVMSLKSSSSKYFDVSISSLVITKKAMLFETMFL